MLSNEIIQKFKNLYQTKFNVVITDEEATQMASDLVNLMQLLLKPDKKEVEETTEERSQNETQSI